MHRLPKLPRARSLARLALPVVAALVIAGTPAYASWTYPLLPHVQGLRFIPTPPDDGQLTLAEFSAVYTNECWHLQNAVPLDSGHVVVRLIQANDCADSVSSWVTDVPLGMLTFGTHSLYVRAVLRGAGADSTVESTTITFDVERGTVPPPPPPPPPPPVDSLGALLLQATLVPGAPTIHDDVTLELMGRVPFDCAVVHDVNRLGTDHLELTISPQPGCVDSTQRWQSAIALGAFAQGSYLLQIDFHVDDPAGGWGASRYVVLEVTDPANPPPPPPPPVDSLKAGLSASHPNPFQDQTSFAVSVAAPTLVDVAVFDLAGRRVVTLHHGVLPTGTTGLAWNGRRRDGTRAAGGIYFYRLTLPDRVVTRRVVLLGTP